MYIDLNFSKETYSYNDPITELIDCLFVKYDFNAAQDRLNECEKLLASPDLLPINSFPSSSSSVPPGGAVGDGDFLEEPLTSSLPPVSIPILRYQYLSLSPLMCMNHD
ncbi:PREDICTED: eukaryotic translation initiation factor 3 subunit E-like [Amphimedon queenslandica]|uniref:Uncharacterized protein n=1 Tax=Amphimedon queenslandica TaxID=400682 RepID=A0AAN0JJ71_AMPQE|nr:PREDICTED: eukaryotic translation initiation factor 3 subunit E-like [Amphimedon queenslandica]|eukprot:XP_019856728.1 PREDICTED: eukaryotic translation initiation factor 3 subunit E-like [Amphimedon queenslandica]